MEKEALILRARAELARLKALYADDEGERTIWRWKPVVGAGS